MRFESHELPDDGNLVPLLRESAKQPFSLPRGDLGDMARWDWVNRMYKALPDWRDRIDDAYETLLTAEEPLPQHVLEQVSKMPVRSFYPRVLSVIEKHHTDLAARPDSQRTNGQSLLGTIVRAAVTMPKTVQPAPALAHTLAAIDRPEDGWPFTFLMALPGDVQGLISQTTAVLQRLDDASFKSFVGSMLADGPPWTGVVFEEIARGPTEVRDRVASAVRRATDEMEQARSALSMMDFGDDPDLQAVVNAAAEKPNPWPEYAARLGVAGLN